MSDFRLRTFYTVAKNLSFTKAAQELFITQPAVTRHINNLEQQYQVRLFERHNNTISLTQAGLVMLKHCERILNEYSQLDYAMHLLNKEHVGQIRLGASTTIAQYILPTYLASFIDAFPKVDISLNNGNSRFIENALLLHTIDIGLVEGVVRQPTLTYTPFLADELIVVSGAHSAIAHQAKHKNYTLSLEEFKACPLVVRERGSGTLEAIEHILKKQKLKLSELNILIYLGSTEAIKLFVKNTDALCILSKASVIRELKDGELTLLKVDNLSFERNFCFVEAPGPQNPLIERFKDFILKYSHT